MARGPPARHKVNNALEVLATKIDFLLALETQCALTK